MNIQSRKPLTYPYDLAPLPFAFDALEPFIDRETMRIHHDKHHQSYITNLNAALKNHPAWHDLEIEELLRRNKELPGPIRQTVYDQGGGHLHHQLFWKMLQPGRPGNVPVGRLALLLDQQFGSFSGFKAKFTEAGSKHFASGWVFLVLNLVSGELEIHSRTGHDSITSNNKAVLLLNDLWEHAYYLKHQSARADYLEAFWNIVNWEYVSERLEYA